MAVSRVGQNRVGDAAAFSREGCLRIVDRVGVKRVALPSQQKTAISIATRPTNLQRPDFGLFGVDPQ